MSAVTIHLPSLPPIGVSGVAGIEGVTGSSSAICPLAPSPVPRSSSSSNCYFESFDDLAQGNPLAMAQGTRLRLRSIAHFSPPI